MYAFTELPAAKDALLRLAARPPASTAFAAAEVVVSPVSSFVAKSPSLIAAWSAGVDWFATVIKLPAWEPERASEPSAVLCSTSELVSPVDAAFYIALAYPIKSYPLKLSITLVGVTPATKLLTLGKLKPNCASAYIFTARVPTMRSATMNAAFCMFFNSFLVVVNL